MTLLVAKKLLSNAIDVFRRYPVDKWNFLASMSTKPFSRQPVSPSTRMSLTEYRHFRIQVFLLINSFHRCCAAKLPTGEICVGPGIPEIGGAMCASGSCVERFPWWVMLLYPPSAISKPSFLYGVMLLLRD